MSAESDKPAGDPTAAEGAPTRRALLALGAVAASTVITVRPALAQAAGSIVNCEIPAPQLGGNKLAANGTVVPAGTKGAVAPTTRALSAEEVQSMLNTGSTPAGMDPNATQAYANYIRRLQAGMSGFTCYASLQMPR